MKKLVLIVIGILMLMLAGCDAPAMNYEVKDKGPDGFFGLKWKSTVKQAVENRIIFPFGMSNEKLPSMDYEPTQKYIGDVKMDSYSNMSFYKNQFYKYYGLFNRLENYNKLRTALLEKYGDPGLQKKYYMLWKFNHSVIMLTYDESDSVGHLVFSQLQLFQESLRIDKTQSDL